MILCFLSFTLLSIGKAIRDSLGGRHSVLWRDWDCLSPSLGIRIEDAKARTTARQGMHKTLSPSIPHIMIDAPFWTGRLLANAMNRFATQGTNEKF
jgi:hypothetical protein